MVQFTATLKKFNQHGEKSGWTYIDIPAPIASKLKPGYKKSFRVKGKLDHYPIEAVALVPMGGGDFIMAINAAMRKGIGKQKGASVSVTIMEDKKDPAISAALMECLADEPAAFITFNKLPKSHRLYFSKWIESAKTETTKAKRIAQSVTALAAGMQYGEMLRAIKTQKDQWL